MKDTIERHKFTITIGIAMAVVMTIISAAFVAGQKFNEIGSKITTLEYNYEIRDEKVNEIEKAIVESKLKQAEINTKLNNIEDLLKEIKTDLKTHKE